MHLLTIFTFPGNIVRKIGKMRKEKPHFSFLIQDERVAAIGSFQTCAHALTGRHPIQTSIDFWWTEYPGDIRRSFSRFLSACWRATPLTARTKKAWGTRYNSALRFSTEHSDTLLVVVSSDRPVSIIQYGMEFRNQSTWRSPTFSTPEPVEFEEWVNGFAWTLECQSQVYFL